MSPFEVPAGAVSDQPAAANYEGAIHLLPVVDSGRTFIEWSVTLDPLSGPAESWRSLLDTLIAEWTDSLRRTLSRNAVEGRL